MLDTFFFYTFALMTLAGAALTVTRSNAVHSALSLIVSLLGVAGLYLLQSAEFLFAVQIILYIGGIMVLFLFVIMLVNLEEASRQRQFNKLTWTALGLLVPCGAFLAWYVPRGAVDLPWFQPSSPPPPGGNTEAIADVLFRDYLLPFEIASLLLLAAVIGSVYMAKKEVGQPEGE